MTTLKIPTPFRPYTDGTRSLELDVDDVQTALEELVSSFPTLSQHLFDDDGSLRAFVNLFLNGEDIRYLQGLDTPLQAGDQLQILPSIAGGRII